jgi:hypothetical protein
VTVSNFVAAITVRVMPEDGGADCAATDVANANTPRRVPVILNSMTASKRNPRSDYNPCALHVEERRLNERRLTAYLWPPAALLFDHAGTLIWAVVAKWLMVRSNKAITSSCVVQGASFSAIRRCLTGMSLHRDTNGALRGIWAAISRASFFSVRFGISKLQLPHANDSAATRQWRSLSWKRFWTQELRSQIRLRASVSNSMSPNGVGQGASNGMYHLEGHIALPTLRG